MDEMKMTKGEKIAQTAKAKRERHEKEIAEAKRERELLHSTLTAILEDAQATPADKAKAVELLMQLKGWC